MKRGKIETIILPDPKTKAKDDIWNIIQTYVDVSGDIQTAALISCYLNKSDGDPRAIMWINQYRKFLNKMNLWKVRANFDISYNRMGVEIFNNRDSFVIHESIPHCPKCEKPASTFHNLIHTKDKKLEELQKGNVKMIFTCNMNCETETKCVVCNKHIIRLNPSYV
jgi:hypothetical protein